jgi:hypothetical protein
MSSPALRRHLSGLSYRAWLHAESKADAAFCAKLLASFRGPSACPGKEALFVTGLLARRLKGVTLPFRSPALRVWLPSRRCKPSLLSEALFSFPRSWASPFRVLSRLCGSVTVSRECAALAFLRQVFRPGTDASAVPAHSASGTFSPSSIFQLEVRPIPS